jgi:hypothetical protein
MTTDRPGPTAPAVLSDETGSLASADDRGQGPVVGCRRRARPSRVVEESGLLAVAASLIARILRLVAPLRPLTAAPCWGMASSEATAQARAPHGSIRRASRSGSRLSATPRTRTRLGAGTELNIHCADERSLLAVLGIEPDHLPGRPRRGCPTRRASPSRDDDSLDETLSCELSKRRRLAISVRRTEFGNARVNVLCLPRPGGEPGLQSERSDRNGLDPATRHGNCGRRSRCGRRRVRRRRLRW